MKDVYESSFLCACFIMFLTQLTKPHLTPRRRQGCQVILRAWLCCSSLHGNVVDSLVPRPHPHALDSAQDDQTGEKKQLRFVKTC